MSTSFYDATLAYFNARGTKYKEINDHAVSVTYNSDHLTEGIRTIVVFDEDGDDDVHVMCMNIANIPKDKMAAGLIAMNTLNHKFRWIKFYMDDDRDVIADCDAVIDMQTCGEEVRRLTNRMASIIDDAYPIIMKAIWA